MGVGRGVTPANQGLLAFVSYSTLASFCLAGAVLGFFAPEVLPFSLPPFLLWFIAGMAVVLEGLALRALFGFVAERAKQLRQEV